MKNAENKGYVYVCHKNIIQTGQLIMDKRKHKIFTAVVYIKTLIFINLGNKNVKQRFRELNNGTTRYCVIRLCLPQDKTRKIINNNRNVK